MTKSDLEAAFVRAWKVYAPGYERPLEQYRFAWKSHRHKWAFDFAFPWATPPLAVEIDGGQWAPHGGRHNTDADRDKLNHAAALGWRVMRFSASMLDDPAGVVAIVREAIGESTRISTGA
jgi:very-short-patch-repair endonuclease